MKLRCKIINVEINRNSKTVEFNLPVFDEAGKKLDVCTLHVEFKATKQETIRACVDKIKAMLQHVIKNMEVEQAKPPADESHIDFADKELEYESGTDELTWKI